MNGEILQMVALCCHANATIRGVEMGSTSPRGPAFDLCDSIRFVRQTRTLFGRVKDRTFASTPKDWLATLKRDGIVRARLGYVTGSGAEQGAIADHVLAAFIGGGGTWYLELVQSANQSSFLAADWQLNTQRARGGRLWRSTYKQISGPSMNASTISVGQATASLKAAIDDAAAFAARQQLANWHTNFMSALDAFDAAKPPRHDNCADLAPPGVLPSDARMLLDACQRAWVFGGMGSWSDMGLQEPDQSEYERVSERLYQSVVGGLIAGANASAP